MCKFRYEDVDENMDFEVFHKNSKSGNGFHQLKHEDFVYNKKKQKNKVCNVKKSRAQKDLQNEELD